ncbi:MAG: HlyD family efflux transporter periplasmic adaptor subunit [Betaproteobacteria bacterium]|nr:MAG: HlyD family efflux transporter periplasmic adaptor subunit [Betaproteobacteria bacterium]
MWFPLVSGGTVAASVGLARRAACVPRDSVDGSRDAGVHTNRHRQGHCPSDTEHVSCDWHCPVRFHSFHRWNELGVKDLATHTPGTVVAPGTILLTLVPKDEPLLAEVWVANLDAGFVQAMQKVRVKLVAYPFQKYGMLDGAVRQVSADAQEKADVNGARNFHDAAYRTLITLDREYLENGERRLRLVPGMLVNAEIHLGTRSVFEYLLSPIQKVAHEAGRER